MKTFIKTCMAILLAAVYVHGREAPQKMSDTKPLVGTAKEPDRRPPAILQEPTVLGTGKTWAVVSWTTNERGKKYSRIYAGIDPKKMMPADQTAASHAANDRVPSYQEQQYMHLVRLNNLMPGTTYYFRADSGKGTDRGVESRSNIWKFTTKAGVTRFSWERYKRAARRVARKETS
jgi:Purple acid Phosphatase, N-terminal domain